MSLNAAFPVVLVREACERPAGTNGKETANESAAPESPDAGPEPINTVASGIPSMKTVLLAGARLLVAENQAERVREITMQLTDLPDAVEPFERIREAIKEALSQIARTPVVRSPAAA